MPDNPVPAPRNVDELDQWLSHPTPEVIELMGTLDGDLVLLGVGGKMGPTLARMALRASQEAGRTRRVIGVSRFSDLSLRKRLQSWGIETIACDLLDEQAVQGLPDAPLVVSMSGFKFGTTGQAPQTWAMNCLLPAYVCRHYTGSRIVAFSTGNVYPLVEPQSGGSRVTDEPQPVGEYGMAALGRERIYQYFAESTATPTAILRLNYATELRYGVLLDIGRDVLEERAVDVRTAWVNVIWQSDACAMTLRAFAHTDSPARVLNLAGNKILRVREVAETFGELLGKRVQVEGEEQPTALLNDGRDAYPLLGEPTVGPEQMIRWTADWLLHAGPTHGKPTKFQVRDGRF